MDKGIDMLESTRCSFIIVPINKSSVYSINQAPRRCKNEAKYGVYCKRHSGIIERKGLQVSK